VSPVCECDPSKNTHERRLSDRGAQTGIRVLHTRQILEADRVPIAEVEDG